MFSITVDASRFVPPQYSVSSHITMPNIPIVPNISLRSSAFMPIPNIQFNNLTRSMNALRAIPDIPPNINNFGKSIESAQQLHSITRAECIRNVKRMKKKGKSLFLWKYVSSEQIYSWQCRTYDFYKRGNMVIENFKECFPLK